MFMGCMDREQKTAIIIMRVSNEKMFRKDLCEISKKIMDKKYLLEN